MGWILSKVISLCNEILLKWQSILPDFMPCKIIGKLVWSVDDTRKMSTCPDIRVVVKSD